MLSSQQHEGIAKMYGDASGMFQIFRHHKLPHNSETPPSSRYWKTPEVTFGSSYVQWRPRLCNVARGLLIRVSHLEVSAKSHVT